MSDGGVSHDEFAAVLISHAKGRAHDEASARLREAVEAVMRTGKPANVSVKLTMHRMTGVDDVLRIESQVTSKVPTEPVTSMWFTDHAGNLHRNNPNQTSLFDTTGVVDGKTAAAGRDTDR